jgi:RNA polymerase sigma-70 factor (ECF subfamily)
MPRPEESDGELLAQWGNGSRRAGERLIERHFATVYGFFRGKVSAELQDLVQQTFLACVEARDRFQQHGSFRAFLLGIARHHLYAHYRQQRRELLDFQLSPLRDLGSSPTGRFERRESERRLHEALHHIPLEAQLILELTYWQGLDGAEIAEVLSIPVNTVYSRLFRAKAMLSEKLRELHDETSGNDLAMATLTRKRRSTPTNGWPET